MPIGFNLRGQGTESLDLDLYEGIGSDPLFGGGISAQSVLDTLSASPKAKKIRVRINSAGGIVTEGLAIYNMLNNHAAEVTCQVDGLAGSIASVIAMSGRLEMPATSYLMIHNPFGWIEGGSDELRHQADVLDSMRGMMLDIYCAKSGKGRDFIGALMDEEKWMTGTEALAYGFADALIQTPKNRLAAHFDLSRFRNTPRSIDTAPRGLALAETRGSSPEAITAENITDAVRQALAAVAEETAIRTTPVVDAPPDEVTITDSPAAIAAAAGEKTMDEQVYKDQIAALEAKITELTAALESEKSARAATDAELIEAKAKFPKKGDDSDDDDDDDEKAKADIVAEAMALTGCKDLAKLSGALVAYSLKTSGIKDTHAARVGRLLKDGKLPPHLKTKALAWSPAQLDGFVEMTGGEKFAPVGVEHQPDDEHEAVTAAKAATKKPGASFDPESIHLTPDEKAACKRMGGADKDYEAKFLANKREIAKAEHDAKRGIAA